MKLMNNTYLNFESIEFLNNYVSNVTTLNLLPDIPEKYYGDDYILKIKVSDDELLEAISFKIYETTDYWDLLMVFNDITRMNQLPVNHDIVLTRADNKLQEWKAKGVLLNSILSDDIIEAKYQEFLEEVTEENEKFRYINYVSKEDLSELIADLEELKDTVKINENLIISSEE
jgi:hypothetical protein